MTGFKTHPAYQILVRHYTGILVCRRIPAGNHTAGNPSYNAVYDLFPLIVTLPGKHHNIS